MFGLKPGERPNLALNRTPVRIAVSLGLMASLFAFLYAGFAYKRLHSFPRQVPVNVTRTKLPSDFLKGAVLLVPNSDVEVSEVSFSRAEVRAVLVNHGSRPVYGTDCSFDLTDDHGHQIGVVSATVAEAPAHGAVPVVIPVPYPKAYFATLREIHPR